MAAGWSDEQIKAYFAEQYGDRVLAEPPRRGFYWLVYILPPLGLLAGGFLVYRAMKDWRTAVPAASAAEPPPPAPDDEYARRVEDEPRRRK